MLQGASSSTPETESLKRGATIGRYVIISLVGRGAMGEVYAAYDPELDRKVAVKLLRASHQHSGTESDAKARLLREAQAIARLSHPNVIVVHDVGSIADRVFLAMEFIDGHTLGYWLRAATRSWRDVLGVFVPAGRGLAAAHASHLVHRDFKLENVMLGRDEKVRVMDFGMAREDRVSTDDPPMSAGAATGAANPAPGSSWTAAGPADLDATRVVPPPFATSTGGGQKASGFDPVASRPSSPMATELTQTGALMGTPAYMAPEQFAGQQADARSDQFSFCVALYEALYGERPFKGDSFNALAEHVLAGNVRPAPDGTAVPGWLRRVVVRGLRRNPDERWPSMDQLIEALSHDPGARRRRIALAGISLLVVVASGVVVRHQVDRARLPSCQVSSDRFAGVWEGSATPGSRRASIATAFQATGKSFAADAFAGVSRLLDSYVGAWSRMYTDACQATYVRGEQSGDVLDLRMACLQDRWNEVRALSGVMAEADASLVSNAVKASAALTSLEGCADVRTLRAALAPPRDPSTRRTVDHIRARLAAAKAMSDAGRLTDSEAILSSLVPEAEGASYAPVLAEVLARLGSIQVRLRRALDADKTLEEAVWVAVAAHHDEVGAEAAVDHLFDIGYLQRDFVRADRAIRHAQALLDRLGGHDLLRARMASHVAAVLDSRGDQREAAARYRTALAIRERVLGPTHPDVATSLTNLAHTLSEMNQPEEALRMFNRAIDITAQALGPKHVDLALQRAGRAETAEPARTLSLRRSRTPSARSTSTSARSAPTTPTWSTSCSCSANRSLGWRARTWRSLRSSAPWR